MKKVLILGAGVYQVPLIKKAKELGIYTIVTSIKGNYPGFDIADKVYYVNTTDCEEIYKIAVEEEIDALLTSGTDVAVKTIGYVNSKLGLIGVSEESSKLVTDKSLMKEALVKGGVRTSQFGVADSFESARELAESIGYPVMFKCVNSSGSRGVIKVSSPDEVETSYNYASSITDKTYIVIEKFIEGYEIGLDGFIGLGQSMFVPHSKLIYNNGKTNVPVGHEFPFDCSKNLYDDILEQAKLAVNALGLKTCFFNMDILIDDDKSYIIEVGARTGATCIPELISAHYDFDFYKMMLDVALGEEVTVPTEAKYISVGKLLLSSKSGVVKEITIPELNHREHISIDVKIGDKVNEFMVGSDRIGQIIVSGEDKLAVYEQLETLERGIILEVD